jgi:ADP-heptose:LPS heptosyltransferase
MRVVLFKVNHLGDNVVFLPIVRELRRRFPLWRITVVTAEAERPLYASTLPAERIWTAADRETFNRSWRRPWQLAAWWRRLRLERPDAVLLSYDQSNTAHLLAKFSGASVRIGATLAFLRVRGSLTHVINQRPAQKIADWNWAMGRCLVTALGADASVWPEFPPAPDLTHLSPTRSYPRHSGPVVIHAGARSVVRRWGAERMLSVAQRLLAEGHPVVWIDRPDTDVSNLPPGIAKHPCTSLTELTTLLANARLFLCNNSGPMHVANALGTPTVMISGASSYDWDPYWHRERTTLLRHATLPCIACENSNLGTDICTNTATPLACLNHWSVDAVTAACRAQLRASAAAADSLQP